MPAKAQTVLASDARFKVLWGGRRSGKTYSFVDAMLTRAAREKITVLCTRELQKSIRDSIHKTICVRISALELDDYFKIEKSSIYSNCGSEIIFLGVRHNPTEIKGLEGIDLCLIEEAEKMSQESWDILEPTISKEGSEIWVNFNPELEDSPTYQMFIVNGKPSCAIAHMTHRDNKYFPEISRQQMEHDRVNDPEKHDWVWEGKLKKYHNALIFGDKIITDQEFEAPDGSDLLFGCDWGYANDPMALNRMYIHEECLWIDYEFYANKVELTELDAAFQTIPGIMEGVIRSDCSRPETISYVRRLGYDVIGEGKLRIEEGIDFLRSFRHIYIHPRCTGAIDDFSNYRWKVDPLTKEIIMPNIPVDKSNHVPDNVRYALRPLIRKPKLITAA